MQPFRQYCDDFECAEYPQRTTPKHSYLLYKEGKYVGSVDSIEDARTAVKNKSAAVFEKVENKDNTYESALQEYERRYGLAVDAWKKDLRNEYADLPDEVFDICYSEAYEDGHSSGHDEIANEMISKSEFAMRIIQSVRGINNTPRV